MGEKGGGFGGGAGGRSSITRDKGRQRSGTSMGGTAAPGPKGSGGASDGGAAIDPTTGNPMQQAMIRRTRRKGLFASGAVTSNPTTPQTGGGPGSPILG